MTSQVTTFSQDARSTWPRAAVFDCDGLLINTAACWRQAFTRALEHNGQRLGDDSLQELNGASVRAASKRLKVSPGLLRAELDAAFSQASLSPLPGAATLLNRLRVRMPLAVATNGPAGLISYALERVHLRDAFDALVSAESHARDKPAPDVYLAACARLGIHPSDAIAFEDSSVGAESARTAGLTVVLVPSDPSQQIAADLRVSRLDDHRLVSLLRLDDTRRTSARWRSVHSHND
jgi:HAD superfamily hydrolase (TIGR01509 family)